MDAAFKIRSYRIEGEKLFSDFKALSTMTQLISQLSLSLPSYMIHFLLLYQGHMQMSIIHTYIQNNIQCLQCASPCRK